ncbi:MAG: hypothetical protein AVDCRST_MAG02-1254 [uncultured Rubrobacteraceae bacterium]|uniref:Uncharacterized protein n=1 Tax=uncultured Rubrobacteraceae bacterium TaxID=349277 RepID=A0A6J4QXK2_9ACTN|nr:MAG: hypothetical protein AVDCRST_MAG02-1254 [uncultured Rubrobacteraceae bacterium]
MGGVRGYEVPIVRTGQARVGTTAIISMPSDHGYNGGVLEKANPPRGGGAKPRASPNGEAAGPP